MSRASFPKDDHRACTDGKSFEKICGEATKRAKRRFASLGTCLTSFQKMTIALAQMGNLLKRYIK